VRVDAIVLAAGLSRRMGRSNKLVQEVAGVSLIGRVVDAVSHAGVTEIIVVTGHQRDEIESALGTREVRCVHNADYSRGMGGSIAVGCSALPADVDAALICLADMPHVRARHIDRLIRAFDPSRGQTICTPVHAGRRGHPVLFGAQHFEALRGLHGDSGARHILEAHAASVCEIVENDAGVTRDIDTPEDLAAPWNARFENLTRQD